MWRVFAFGEDSPFFVPSVAVPKIALRLGAPRDFDRCLSSASLFRPQGALGSALSVAVPKIALRLGAPRDFDRCLSSASLFRPQGALGSVVPSSVSA